MLNVRSLIPVSVLVLVVLSLAGCGAPSVPPNVTEVTITVTESGCAPGGFDTRQGNIVYVTLNNTGTTEASFIYPDGPYTFTAPAGQSVQGNFTSPTVTGSYPYQCGLTGSPEMSTGQMRVR